VSECVKGLLAAGVLGDCLGAFGYSVFGEFSRK
jgi:hypothetical protein